MKITDFENEDALDLVADLIEPAIDIFSDKKLRELIEGKGNKALIVKHILKNHQKSIVEVFARLNDTPVEEYRCNVISLTKDILDVMNDKELMAVFTSSEQKMEKKSSGSAMVNTED